MSYPPPPPGAAGYPGGKPRLRGRTPLRLAIIFLVLGIAGIIAGGVVALNGALKKVDNFQRITVPSATSTTIATKRIDFGGTGGFIAYYESKNAKSSGIPNIPIQLTSPSGAKERLDTPYGGKSGGTDVRSLSYDYNGHKGVALWQFTIREKGTYTVEVAGNSNEDSDATIAFGRSIGKSTAVGASLIIVGVLLLIAGIILLIIGLVKRSHSKKEHAAAQTSYGQQGVYGPPLGYGPQQPAGQQYPPPPPNQGGYPPPGYGGTPPSDQPPYGQPPYGQAPYGQNPPGQAPPDNPWPPQQN